MSAVDWLSVSLNVDHSKWETWGSLFAAAKDSAGDGVEAGGLVQVAEGMVIDIQPSGAGRGYSYCKYVAQWEGMLIYFADRGLGKSPNVRFEISGRVCLRLGASEAARRVLRLMEAMESKVEGSSVSRVDIATDTNGISMGEVEQHLRTDCVVKRSRKSQINYGDGGFTDPESIYLGLKESTHLCIYNKLREAEGDPEYLQELQELRWGWKPEQVTRFEFRLKRDELRERGIQSLEDLEKLPDLLAWLATEHTRFTARPVTDHNQAHTPVAPWWHTVSMAALHLGPLKDADLLPVPKGAGGELQKQAMGCLTSWMVAQGAAPVKKSDFIHWAMECIKDYRSGLDKVRHKTAAKISKGYRGRTVLYESLIRELKAAETLLKPGSCYAWGH